MKASLLLLGTIFITKGSGIRNDVSGIKLKRPTKLIGPDFQKIVGGNDAIKGSHPYIISLQATDFNEEKYHTCGGTIYDDHHVITAAHCVTGQNPTMLRVVAGAHDIFNNDGREQFRDVSSFVAHPQYDPFWIDNDIALIRVTSPFIFNSRVQPVEISEKEAEGSCVNAGWGNTRDDFETEFPAILQEVKLDVVPRTKCIERYSNISPITNSMVCAGVPEGGKGSCNGDSGGPLICTVDGKEILVGIVSWGMIPCAMAAYPTVFTNIPQFRQWIDDMIG